MEILRRLLMLRYASAATFATTPRYAVAARYMLMLDAAATLPMP